MQIFNWFYNNMVFLNEIKKKLALLNNCLVGIILSIKWSIKTLWTTNILKQRKIS